MINLVKLEENNFFKFESTLIAFRFITENRIDYRIVDCDVNEKSYCVINTQKYRLTEFTNEINSNSKFANQFSKVLDNSNIEIILINLHETEYEEDINYFYKSLKNNKRILIANNDINFDKSKFNHQKTHMIESAYGSGYLEKDIDFVENKKGKKFLCLNNLKKEHRIALLSILKYENILDDINYSLLDDNYYSVTNGVCDVEKYKNEIDFFSKKKYNTDNDKNANTFEINKKDFENSFINIVTESFFLEKNKIHISEKTLKPFWFYQFPLILASPNHIKYAKKYYNFDFFDDIIDHSYDEIVDNKHRMLEFVKEIKRLNDLDMRKIYSDNKERFISNRKICESFCTSYKDYLFFKKIFI